MRAVGSLAVVGALLSATATSASPLSFPVPLELAHALSPFRTGLALSSPPSTVPGTIPGAGSGGGGSAATQDADDAGDIKDANGTGESGVSPAEPADPAEQAELVTEDEGEAIKGQHAADHVVVSEGDHVNVDVDVAVAVAVDVLQNLWPPLAPGAILSQTLQEEQEEGGQQQEEESLSKRADHRPDVVLAARATDQIPYVADAEAPSSAQHHHHRPQQYDPEPAQVHTPAAALKSKPFSLRTVLTRLGLVQPASSRSGARSDTRPGCHGHHRHGHGAERDDHSRPHVPSSYQGSERPVVFRTSYARPGKGSNLWRAAQQYNAEKHGLDIDDLRYGSAEAPVHIDAEPYDSMKGAAPRQGEPADLEEYEDREIPITPEQLTHLREAQRKYGDKGQAHRTNSAPAHSRSHEHGRQHKAEPYFVHRHPYSYHYLDYGYEARHSSDHNNAGQDLPSDQQRYHHNHHHHRHRHHQAGLARRLRTALLALRPLEAVVVVFVLGAGAGAVVHAIGVLALVALVKLGLVSLPHRRHGGGSGCRRVCRGGCEGSADGDEEEKLEEGTGQWVDEKESESGNDGVGLEPPRIQMEKGDDGTLPAYNETAV